MNRRHVFIAVTVALSLGALIPNAFTNRHEPARAKSDVLIVENDAQNGAADQSGEDSAKMGKEPGTHTGSNQATQPESDTQKIDQPPRRNVPSDDANPH